MVHCENWRATRLRTGGRPAQELTGDQAKNWRATSPRSDGRPGQGLAGDQPKNWRATNPRTGGLDRLAALSWGLRWLAGCALLGLRRLAKRALLGAAPACWLRPLGGCAGLLAAPKAIQGHTGGQDSPRCAAPTNQERVEEVVQEASGQGVSCAC